MSPPRRTHFRSTLKLLKNNRTVCSAPLQALERESIGERPQISKQATTVSVFASVPSRMSVRATPCTRSSTAKIYLPFHSTCVVWLRYVFVRVGFEGSCTEFSVIEPSLPSSSRSFYSEILFRFVACVLGSFLFLSERKSFWQKARILRLYFQVRIVSHALQLSLIATLPISETHTFRVD